jgi:hypothetical protein
MAYPLHHLTYVVADLRTGLRRLQAMFPPESIVREPLSGRGVDTVRARVGDAWLVFVAPAQEGEPMQFLARHGEGLMTVSLWVPSLEQGLEDYARRGIGPRGEAREGLDRWRVQDLDLVLPGGGRLQLCEERGRTSRQFAVPGVQL